MWVVKETVELSCCTHANNFNLAYQCFGLPLFSTWSISAAWCMQKVNTGVVVVHRKCSLLAYSIKTLLLFVKAVSMCLNFIRDDERNPNSINFITTEQNFD